MNRLRLALRFALLAAPILSALPAHAAVPTLVPPRHIVLVMADDMGWGETSYNRHPVLKTPHLDEMAAHGLRFDRFYAGAPNCSPTRASVLTGRSNDRTGVVDHGFPLRRQEKTLAQALRAAGFVTGHFGKWHLSGYQGPGAPVLASDERSPGGFGFDEWVSVTNFFDRDPLLGRQGKPEQFQGDSSEVIVAEALRFLERHAPTGKPTFTVVWYGSPHAPFAATADDKRDFAALAPAAQNHFGELVALDRSIGTLRRGLRRLGIAENTLLFFCSDNGGLPNLAPGTVGGLRGFKNSVYEGGLRVPALLEWPAVVKSPRITSVPAATYDLFPTLVDLLGLSASALLAPHDGTSLKPLLTSDALARPQPLGFRHLGRGAWIDGHDKLVVPKVGAAVSELYDLASDPHETRDLATQNPALAARLRAAFDRWSASVEASVAGQDYPERRVFPVEPTRRRWRDVPDYQPFLETWKARPEFRAELTGAAGEEK